MSELGSGTQADWYALGTLLTQLGFLFAGLWFARNFLKTIRVFQEQVGALLKLSITSPTDPHSAGARRSLGETSPYWLTPSLTRTAGPPAPADPRVNRLAVSWSHLILWLQTPMNTPGLDSWRRLIHWLQAPAGS